MCAVDTALQVFCVRGTRHFARFYSPSPYMTATETCPVLFHPNALVAELNTLSIGVLYATVNLFATARNTLCILPSVRPGPWTTSSATSPMVWSGHFSTCCRTASGDAEGGRLSIPALWIGVKYIDNVCIYTVSIYTCI